MSDPTSALWRTRFVTFLLAAIAAASASFWMLKWPVPSRLLSAPVLANTPLAIDVSKVASLLGAKPNATEIGQSNPVASLQSRFKLLGVIAQGEAGAHGSALIAVDGAPAKPYRVGQVVVDNVALQSVTAGSAALAAPGQPQGSITLSLPVLQVMLQKQ
jgi:general secretion pathway protein C